MKIVPNIYCITLLVIALHCSGCKDPTKFATDSSSTVDLPKTTSKLTFERMSPLVAAYREINDVLKLNENEKQVMDAVKSQYKKKFEDWYNTQGIELKKLERKFLNAARSKNLAAMRSMKSNGERTKMDKFKNEEREMQIAFEKDLIDAIPAEKLDQWKAHRISELLLEFLGPINLSEDQIGKIRIASKSVIQKLKAESNWQGYGTSNLEKQFQRNIMLQEQAIDFEQLQNKNKMRMLRWNNLS